jgi:hypothetical protein
MGGYNGKHSFDAFTHEKGVLVKGLRPDIALRFPPFTQEKVSVFIFILVCDLLSVVYVASFSGQPHAVLSPNWHEAS